MHWIPVVLAVVAVVLVMWREQVLFERQKLDLFKRMIGRK